MKYNFYAALFLLMFINISLYSLAQEKVDIVYSSNEKSQVNRWLSNHSIHFVLSDTLYNAQLQSDTFLVFEEKGIYDRIYSNVQPFSYVLVILSKRKKKKYLLAKVSKNYIVFFATKRSFPWYKFLYYFVVEEKYYYACTYPTSHISTLLSIYTQETYRPGVFSEFLSYKPIIIN